MYFTGGCQCQTAGLSMGKLFLGFAWKLNHYESDRALHATRVTPHQDPEKERMSWPRMDGGTHCKQQDIAWQLPTPGSTTAVSVQWGHVTQTFPEGWAATERLELWKVFLPYPRLTLFTSRRVIRYRLLAFFLERIPEPIIQARQDRPKSSSQTAGEERWTQVKPNSVPAVKQNRGTW